MPMDPSSVWCQWVDRKKKLHYLTPQKWDCIEWLNQKRCYTGQETHEVGFSSISGGQINENEIQFVQIIF